MSTTVTPQLEPELLKSRIERFRQIIDTLIIPLPKLSKGGV